ncbi:MAG TPA: sialate O-acetylesterase [Rariglobus sp.]|jgi:sialate O-acetylesterase|nr:sialate O-acetylesterase [Rariglobus sp.]
MKSSSRSLRSLGAALALTLSFTLSAVAEVRLPNVFSDHMVLQRDMPIPVWGWADPGELVTIKLAQSTATATADAHGEWRTILPKQSAGGPFTLTASGSSTVTREDVLIGEVWLCSGQSNMEFGIKMGNDAAAEVAAASHPQIRLLLVAKKNMALPQPDVVGSWAVCSPETIVQGGWGGFSAAAYFFAREINAKLNVPVGVIESSWGGTRIEPWTPPVGFAGVPALADISERVQMGLPSSPVHQQALSKVITETEAWQKAARESLTAGTPPPSAPTFPADLWAQSGYQSPSALYNGMIHGLVPYAIRGALWYQGESNHTEGALYTEKMKALIGGWRQLWQEGPFPFYFVQIAPYRYGNENSDILPVFWEAQAAALNIPNTGMAVTNDIGNVNDIHPKNKQDVGHRLALLALAGTYGQKNLVSSGPILKALKIEDGKLRVIFDSAGDGLSSRDGKPLSNFEIIDADKGGFVPAQAVIEGNSVVLSSPDAPHPVAVRFAWDKLAEPNLTNSAGLPASAFRAGEVPVHNTVDLPEAQGFQLVYDLDLHKAGATISYDTDNHAKITGTVDRIAYFIELGSNAGDAKYLFVSMDPFTTDLSKIGVPTAESHAHFQQNVTNLVVATNVTGIASGARKEGNIEFWPGNYTAANGANVPGASSSAYDFGDQPSGDAPGYGSMQVHDFAAKQTLFAFNDWRMGAQADLGIGSAPAGNPDWTFARNGAGYTIKRLRVLVHTH